MPSDDAEQIAESANCSMPADVAGVVGSLATWASVAREAEKLWSGELSADLERAAAMLTTLASGRDEVPGKPVAWMRWKERELHHGKDLEWQPLSAAERAAGWSEIPLYAIPPQGDQQ